MFSHTIDRLADSIGRVYCETIYFTHTKGKLAINIPRDAIAQVMVDKTFPITAAERRSYGLTGVVRDAQGLFCDCEDKGLLAAARKFLDTGKGVEEVFRLALEFAGKLKGSID